MTARLGESDAACPVVDPAFLGDSKAIRSVVRRLAFCRLIAEEKLPALLPDVLKMLPYYVSLLDLTVVMDRREKQLRAKDIHAVWPAAYPFLVLPPKEVLPILERHLFSLPTYGARRAAFELAEVVRLRASGKDVTGTRALNRLLTALYEADLPSTTEASVTGAVMSVSMVPLA